MGIVLDSQEILRLAAQRWGSDRKIGAACGVSWTTIWRIRTGLHERPRVSTMRKIATALGRDA